MSLKKGSFALEVAHKCYNCAKKYKEFLWILIELRRR